MQNNHKQLSAQQTLALLSASRRQGSPKNFKKSPKSFPWDKEIQYKNQSKIIFPSQI